TTLTLNTTHPTPNLTSNQFTITIQHTITPLVNLTPTQPSQLFTPINPITITPTHNTPKLLTHTLTRFPQPLKFHPSTNSILPTPTQIPTNTITIHSTHPTPNK
ncbi:hypothetical protein, partial [Staphylococcus epidermidis]